MTSSNPNDEPTGNPPPKSFLPIVSACANFVPSLSPEPLAVFSLSRSPGTSIGLLRPGIVQALIDDNELKFRSFTESAKSGTGTGTGHSDRDAFDILREHRWDRDRVTCICFEEEDYELGDKEKRAELMRGVLERWRDESDTGPKYKLITETIGGRMWRDELYPVLLDPFGPRENPNVVMWMERSACELFGIVTYGVHLTMYLDAEEGMKVWIAKRSMTKQTWPGYLDNSVAGGIPLGMSALDAIVKECAEEASLAEAFVRRNIKPVGAISYFFQKPNGSLQPEVQYTYDLKIPKEEVETRVPKPEDGEVDSFELLTLDEIASKLHQGLFKPNCGAIMIDFLIRHGYITPESEPHYLQILTLLHGRFEWEKWTREEAARSGLGGPKEED